MENNPGWSDTQKIIALILVSSLIVIIFAWMFFPPKGDPGSIAVLNTLVGGLLGAASMVVTYFFGSSKTSSQKDETIARMASTANTAGEKLNGNGNGGGSAPPTPVETMNVETENTVIKEK